MHMHVHVCVHVFVTRKAKTNLIAHMIFDDKTWCPGS